MKIYKDHAFIVSDGAGPHGIQVFDLTRLRTMKPQPNGLPQKVEADYIYREVNSVHDIVINEESGFAYAVGSSAGGNTCGGGLHMMDIHESEEAEVRGLLRRHGNRPRRTGYIARRAVRDVQGTGQALQGPRDLHRLERDGAQPRGRDRQEEPEGHLARGLSERRLHAPGLVHRGSQSTSTWTTRLDETAERDRQDADADLGLHGPRESEAREGALRA